MMPINHINNIAVIGCAGAIGRAVTEHLSTLFPKATIHGFCRSQSLANLLDCQSVTQSALQPTYQNSNVIYQTINYSDEAAIEAAAILATKGGIKLDLVFVATGLLHNDSVGPEKSLKDLSATKMMHILTANMITPTLIAKHFLPQLNHQNQSFFAVLSARVGSISDNRLGGWYSYRASKAALNMVIKTAAIETGRRNKQAVVVGLHPGTVDSELSKPFQSNVPKHQLFTPEFAAQQMLQVLLGLSADHTGQCFAWDGQEIAP